VTGEGNGILLLPFRERISGRPFPRVAAAAALPWAMLFVTFGDKGARHFKRPGCLVAAALSPGSEPPEVAGGLTKCRSRNDE